METGSYISCSVFPMHDLSRSRLTAQLSILCTSSCVLEYFQLTVALMSFPQMSTSDIPKMRPVATAALPLSICPCTQALLAMQARQQAH